MASPANRQSWSQLYSKLCYKVLGSCSQLNILILRIFQLFHLRPGQKALLLEIPVCESEAFLKIFFVINNLTVGSELRQQKLFVAQ